MAHLPTTARIKSSSTKERCLLCPDSEILEQIPAHLVLASSVSIFKKLLDSHWSEIFPVAPVSLLSPFIDNFLNTVTSDYLCFPLTPNPRPAYVVIIGLRGHSYH